MRKVKKKVKRGIQIKMLLMSRIVKKISNSTWNSDEHVYQELVSSHKQ